MLTDDHAGLDEPARLLHALRAAGCYLFIEDGALYCSPPLRHVEWADDPEAAIEEHYFELKLLVTIRIPTLICQRRCTRGTRAPGARANVPAVQIAAVECAAPHRAGKVAL